MGGDILIAGVLVEISNKNVDKIFDYKIPDDLISDIRVGIRVLVPFGRMNLEGFVLEIKDKSTSNAELRSITSIVDKDIVLNEELLKLGVDMQKETASNFNILLSSNVTKSFKGTIWFGC